MLLWRLALPLLAAVAALLTLANLGRPMLWQDEAQTALIARTVVEHGKPLGSDGSNSFSQEQGAEIGPGGVWVWHPWFPFYVLALCFGLFGESTFVARLPFAFFGLFGILGAVALARSVWRSRRAALIAGVLLTLDVPYLLLARQCRYYSVAAALSVLALLAYRLSLEGAPHGPWLFAALALLLFHTHYVYFGVLVAACLIDAAFTGRRALQRTALACAVPVSGAVAWFAWMGPPPHGDRFQILEAANALPLTGSFIAQLARYVVPWPVVVAAVVLAGARLRAPAVHPSAARLLVLFVGSTLGALAFTAYADFFRNLAPVVPVVAVLMAGAIELAWRRHAALGGALLILALSNQPLKDYVYELTHDFVGPVEGIVTYLRRNAHPNSSVAVTYEDLPVKFYTKMRVVGALTGEDLAPSLKADWIVIRRNAIADEDARMAALLETHVDWRRYERITLAAPDTPFENRESPQEHLFRTAENVPPVVIFRRSAPRSD